MTDFLKNAETTLVFAIRDNDAGHNIPSMSMGQTEDGKTIVAKAVFADQESADLMASHMNKQPGAHENRFDVVIVELWRPTDIELYVRDRLRQAEKEKGPKIQLIS
ncbi:hypothetical protein W70_48 [Escherichia phage W70]|nr:hypothetical protein W70_48 [Escherichia phage W70]